MSADIKGGAKLIAHIKGMEQRLSEVDTVSIGFLAGATYPDGKPVAMIAAIQEYGAPAAKIPSRPYFRRMIADKSPTWGKSMANLCKQYDYSSAKVLDGMGQGITAQLQRSIQDLTDPPLAPATIKRKGFAKPLIDTNVMVNSASYKVDAK